MWLPVLCAASLALQQVQPVASASASAAAGPKRVMLWTTVVPPPTNATLLNATLAELATVKDVVDVVSPCSYAIDHAPPHHLVKHPGARQLHKALMAAGFKVQPLVGDSPGGWNMSWYRSNFKDPLYSDQCSQEILDDGLEGQSVSPLHLYPEPLSCFRQCVCVCVCVLRLRALPA
jgi:hypothetical protein